MALVSLGVPEVQNQRYRCKVGEKTLMLQPGFEAIRQIGEHQLHCRIEKGDVEGPEFVVNCTNPPFSKRERVCADVVKAAFKEIGYESKRRWGGLEFFGLCLQNQINALNMDPYLCHEKENNPVKVTDNAHRNAGPTSSLNHPAQVARNKFINDLVNFTSFGDIPSKLFLMCLIMCNHPSIDMMLKSNLHY